MKRILVGLTLLVLVLLTGCIHADYVRYADYYGPAKPANRPIEVLDRGTIKRPFKVLGIVTAEVAAIGVNTDQVVNTFRNEAIKRGGDALIDFGVDTPTSNLVKIGSQYQTVNNPRYEAKIIVWDDAPTGAVASP